jgi:hypothetical protein
MASREMEPRAPEEARNRRAARVETGRAATIRSAVYGPRLMATADLWVLATGGVQIYTP